MKIVAEVEEGYRIVAWSGEYIKLTNGKKISQIIPNTIDSLVFTFKQSYVIKIFAVKNENFGVISLNYINRFYQIEKLKHLKNFFYLREFL